MKRFINTALSFICGMAVDNVLMHNAMAKINELKYKKSFSFDLAERWLTFLEEGHCISESLSKMGYYNIAIYGYGKLGRHLYRQIKDTKIKVRCFVDEQNIDAPDGIRVYRPENQIPDVDVIIVTVIDEYDEIVNQYYKSVNNVISLNDLV